MIPRQGRSRDLLFVLLAIAVVIVGSRLLPNIDAQKVLHDVASSLGAATYAVAVLAAFLETGAFVGLILPGETVVILAGAVAGQGETSIAVTIVVVWLGAFAGDSTSFWIGRRLGRGFALRHGAKLRITEERLERVEAYFERYGGRTIVIGRFIGFIRALAPFVAGTSGWRYRVYFPYGLTGTALWAAAFCLIGYFASKHINDAVRVAGDVTLALGVVAAIGVVIAVAVIYTRRADESQRFRAGLIVLGAATGVGLAVLVAYAIYLGAHPGPTALDASAFDVAHNLRSTWLVDVSKVLTALGSSAVMLPLAAIAAFVLAMRRRWSDLVMLAVALVIVYLAVDGIKALVDRPRPANPLVTTFNESYPSGHAAHAAIYPFLAVLVVARARLGRSATTAVLVAGFAIAIIVGLTRVYLRAHFLTDVLGGWGLGTVAFAGSVAATMLILRLRQNERDGAAAG